MEGMTLCLPRPERAMCNSDLLEHRLEHNGETVAETKSESKQLQESQI